MSSTTSAAAFLLVAFLSVAAKASEYRPAPTPPARVPPPPSPKPSYTIPQLPKKVPSFIPHVKTSYSEIDLWLIPHNMARQLVGLPPLKWADYLAAYAQNWVNKQRSSCNMVHSGGPYGENIFWGSGSGWGPADAIKSWVDERRDYSVYSNMCFNGDCGHYTQIVWKKTTRIGCAKVVCDNNRGVFISCNYDPPGNVIGQKPY